MSGTFGESISELASPRKQIGHAVYATPTRLLLMRHALTTCAHAINQRTLDACLNVGGPSEIFVNCEFSQQNMFFEIKIDIFPQSGFQPILDML